MITSVKSNISFKGWEDITLKYVLEERKHLLPQRILARVQELQSSINQPTLKQLHADTYEALLQCKTLEEAKEKYAEFSDVEDSIKLIGNRSKGVKAMLDKGFDLREISLLVLQRLWGKLDAQEEIASDLGLTNRAMMFWLTNILKIPRTPKNYPVLVASSDKILNGEIGAKTRAFNLANPEKMRAKNKHAAQGCKTAEYREAQSKRMIEYDKNHPERREKIGRFTQEIWDEIERMDENPSVRLKFKETFRAHLSHPEFEAARLAMAKRGKEKLTDADKRAIKGFYSDFWQTYPQLKERFGEAARCVSARRKNIAGQ